VVTVGPTLSREQNHLSFFVDFFREPAREAKGQGDGRVQERRNVPQRIRQHCHCGAIV